MTAEQFKSFADRAKALPLEQQSRLLKAIVTALEITHTPSAADWRYALSREIERYPEPGKPTGDEFNESFQGFVLAVSQHAALNTPASLEKLTHCCARLHSAIPDIVETIREPFPDVESEIEQLDQQIREAENQLEREIENIRRAMDRE